jgi:hypothetical protein
LERVYFGINKRNLPLEAILWSLLPLVFKSQNENSNKKGIEGFLESEDRKVYEGKSERLREVILSHRIVL